MTSLAVCGLRGGAGTSTLVAALGFALQAQGANVLLVDLCPENMLRLHFGLGLGQAEGWARTEAKGGDWRTVAFQVLPGLTLLPYGETSAAESAAIERLLGKTPELWRERIDALSGTFDWILFDLPQRLPGHAGPLLGAGGCELRLRTMNVDPASEVLLQRELAALDADTRLLVNRYDPTSQLQRDLMQIWLERHAARLAPQPIHEDVAVAEALASKMPLGLYAPRTLAAVDVGSLAIWCLAQGARVRARRRVQA